MDFDLTASEAAVRANATPSERDFSLLKTGEWAILASQSPGFRETRG